MQLISQNSSSVTPQEIQQKKKQYRNNKQQQSSSQKISKQQKGIICNCKKSKCQKMYCQCFTAGQKCGEFCRCIDCQNTIDRINDKLIINENYQNLKLLFNKRNSQYKGCNCMKSNCLKKYCQCFQNKLLCTQNCKCQECKNTLLECNKKTNNNNQNINLDQKQSIIESTSKNIKNESQIDIQKDIQKRIDSVLKMVSKSSQEKVLKYLHMLLTIK